MTDKPDWNWDNTHDCEVAFHNGYMIKAERDESPSNPFEDWDGNWPTMIYHGRGDGFTTYDKTKGVSIDAPLDRFTDHQLIHDQIAIAKALDTTILDLTCYEDEPVRYCHDATFLREAFENEIGNVPDSQRLATFEALYKLLGIRCYQTTSRGHCQGDWAEVLVVATPEAQTEFGRTEDNVREQAITELCQCEVRTDATEDVVTKQIDTIWEKDLEGTADLWGDWAWGNVYGYTLWAPEFDEDGEVEDWVQLDDSCWGFYGDDHDKSGLEEQALSALPDEPVRVPDKIEELAA